MHRVLMLAFPVVQTLDVVGPLEVFAHASGLAPASHTVPYELTLAAPEAGSVATSCGVPLHASHGFAEIADPPDTLILAGGPGARAAARDPAIVDEVRRLAERAPRVATVCTGAFVLAATGLLDGRRAVTHWAHCRRLGERFPAVTVDPDAIFVVDGKFHTSAGVTAGIDLALALVERDHGRATALTIARELVVFLKRPGGQSQFSDHLLADGGEAREERFHTLGDWMRRHLAADLSVEALAERAAMSPRNFARRFRAAMGSTPGQYVQRLRLDAARRLLTGGDAPAQEIAALCGFGTVETMRLAFQRHLKIAPRDFRARFRPASVAPSPDP
jgi:transcriptional regulator GlxA family with amidase domain